MMLQQAHGIAQRMQMLTGSSNNGLLGLTSHSLRAFAWRPKQIPLKTWNIVRGDQVSELRQVAVADSLSCWLLRSK